MATSKIKGGVETFNGTLGENYSSGSCYGMYDQTNGLVRINFSAGASTAQATTEVLFTIPEKYRPSSSKAGTVIGLSVASGSSAIATAGSCSVNSSGQIRQGASNARTHFLGIIEYKL